MSAEVIDLATLSPIDHDTILESVAKTGRLVIVHEAPATAASARKSPRRWQSSGLYDLQAPIQRVTGYDTVMPLFRLEYDYIPERRAHLDGVRATFVD